MENFHESVINKETNSAQNESDSVIPTDETIAGRQQVLTDLFTKNANSPISVRAVLARNAESIRSNVLQKYLDATLLQAVNFEELCEQADVLNQKLIQHGLVENISQSLDSRGTFQLPMVDSQFPSTIYTGQNAPRDLPVIDVVANLNVVPIKKFIAKTGTNIGNNEGDGYLEFQLRNIFGGGERLRLDFTKGTKTHSSYVMNYTQPATPWWIWDSMFFKNSRQFGNNGSMELIINGFRSSLRSGFFGANTINHELFYETEWRTSKITSLQASDTFLFQAGDDIKCSLGHTVVLDKRDNAVSPSTGSFLKLSNELAINKFWKTQIEFSHNKSWFENNFLTMSCTNRAGYIKNLQSGSFSLRTYDKFQNGGANDIRSFKMMGLGPKDLFDSVGGDAFIAYGVSLFSRLPVKRWAHSNFRLHWFFNGGKLINHNDASASKILEDILSQHSLSTGVGIVLRHPVARFELNFTLPLVCHSGDMIRKGLQYGIGVSFL